MLQLRRRYQRPPTLLAYFWRDWWVMGSAGLRDFLSHRLRFREHSQQARLLWLNAPGSVTAAVTGLLLDDWIEASLRQPWLVALALASVGVVMLVVDRRARQVRDDWIAQDLPGSAFASVAAPANPTRLPRPEVGKKLTKLPSPNVGSILQWHTMQQVRLSLSTQ